MHWIVLLWIGSSAYALPKGFVYVSSVAPDIVQEMRYGGSENFIGEPIDGYVAPRAILSTPAALALKEVQETLRPFGLGLKIYDAYRPQRAVDHFVRWARDVNDTRMKAHYYPTIPKDRLFTEGYIAARSGHSRGSTVDLTLIDLHTHQTIDMGSNFDFFSPLSWPKDGRIDAHARAHRMLLQWVMEAHGWSHYDAEWWHFTLRHEPYPSTYFDFPVE